MKLFYAIAAGVFAAASYQVSSDSLSQPLVSLALGGGMGWFMSLLVFGE